MLKRIFDFTVAIILIFLFSPLIVIVSFLIWRQDGYSPFYIAPRVGKGEKIFKMIKFRSMIVNADKSGVDSTSVNDNRITKLGQFIRKFKIDEIPNFFNIVFGEMSFVGPRPNVERETKMYTNVEKQLLDVKPGITDFSSIIFSDEGSILENSEDPDLDYNQLIRPWKSRLGVLYVKKRTLAIDIKLMLWTALAIFSQERSSKYIVNQLTRLKADKKLIDICKRNKKLEPYPPPGTDKIVENRNL